MRKNFLFAMSLLLLSGNMVQAQEVERAKVDGQVAAAQSAQADLKKIADDEKPWKFSGVLGLNAAATGLVNWAAGGNNNVNGIASAKFRLLYHENNMAWETNLNMEYGLTWIDQQYDQLQKSGDNLQLTTKYGWEFKKTWYLTVLGGFQTQFAYGRSYSGSEAFDPIISKFLAPSYTDVSVGIDWKPNDIFSIYLSPVAGRITTVYVSKGVEDWYKDQTKDEGTGYEGDDLERQLKDKYGVWKNKVDENGKVTANYNSNARAELGLSFKAGVNYTYKDLKIISTLGLFTPYAWNKKVVYDVTEAGKEGQYTEEGLTNIGLTASDPNVTLKGYLDNNRRFGFFDVDWDTSISYQFLKCLQISLTTSLKYYPGVMIDKTVDKGLATEHVESKERVQFKGVLGIGVGYSF